MGERYLVSTRFGLIQQIVNLVSNGYIEYQFGAFPEHKEKDFLKLDKKMLEAYQADFNSDKRYYRKTKGLCNVKFLRSNNVWILLKTEGKNDNENLIEKQFSKIKEKPLVVEVAKNFFVELRYNKEKDSYTYFINKETFRSRREYIRSYINKHQLNEAATVFNMLNGIPSWGGIYEQKKMLKKYLIDYAKKRNQFTKEEIKKFRKSLVLVRTRKIFTVFDDWYSKGFLGSKAAESGSFEHKLLQNLVKC